MKKKYFFSFLRNLLGHNSRKAGYLAISILTAILILSTAAYCSFCSIDLGQGTDTDSISEENDAVSDGSETENDKDSDDKDNQEAGQDESETSAEGSEEETAAVADDEGSPPVIEKIEVTDPSSGVTYDALATDVPAEWKNQLPTSHELKFHLEVSDPDGEDMFCMLSDSNGNNYEPIPAVNGNIDFFWTTPADPGQLTMTFKIIDDSDMETVKELEFKFISY
jgi:hypothetical protein